MPDFVWVMNPPPANLGGGGPSTFLILEAIAVGIAAGFGLHYLFELHPVFCILGGIAIAAGYTWVHTLRVIGPIVIIVTSLAWAGAVGYATYSEAHDWIWTVAAAAAMFAITFFFKRIGAADLKSDSE